MSQTCGATLVSIRLMAEAGGMTVEGGVGRLICNFDPFETGAAGGAAAGAAVASLSPLTLSKIACCLATSVGLTNHRFFSYF